MKPATLRKMAKRLAEDLHHEARLDNILDKIEYHYTIVWADGFAEGYEQGRSPLVPVDEVLEFVEAQGDATGEP